MKKITAYLRDLSTFEKGLLTASLLLVSLAFALSGFRDILSYIASLIGVTALIFVAKGYVIGQILTVVFAVFYGIISFFFRYYGEMMTYLGMTAPMAVLAAAEWIKNPYRETSEVKVGKMTVKTVLFLFFSAIAVTVIFYYILGYLDNASLATSTFSVTTSYIASALTFLRSPYYALAYAANDIVLVALWLIAAGSDFSCFPMAVCFVMFFANDMYGFFNWKRMEKRQKT